jgi:hypothetical protein
VFVVNRHKPVWIGGDVFPEWSAEASESGDRYLFHADWPSGLAVSVSHEHVWRVAVHGVPTTALVQEVLGTFEKSLVGRSEVMAADALTVIVSPRLRKVFSKVVNEENLGEPHPVDKDYFKHVPNNWVGSASVVVSPYFAT